MFGFFSTPGSSAGKSPTAMKVSRLIAKCSICDKKLAEHQFAEIATTVIRDENKPRVLALYDHVKKHEWNTLSAFKDFQADLDSAIVYAVRGPHAGGLVVLTRDPVELWADPEIFLEETVTDDELAIISSLVRDRQWEEL